MNQGFFPLSHTVSYGPIVPIFCKGLHLKPFYGREGEKREEKVEKSEALHQRYTYRVLQTIQMKIIFLCVSEEPAIFGSTKTALKLKYEI